VIPIKKEKSICLSLTLANALMDIMKEAMIFVPPAIQDVKCVW
jgi:hypothetical protein